MKYLKIIGAAIMMVSCTAAIPIPPSPQANMKEIVANPASTLVDVRIPEQFAEKTAKGAVNIPLATIQENIDFFKNKGSIVVFCNSGKQSAEAMEILRKNGIENVYYGKTLKNIEAIQNEK